MQLCFPGRWWWHWWSSTTFAGELEYACCCSRLGKELIVARHALGRGYTEARTDTTQQSGQTPDKEVEIKNITVYVSGYTETHTTGMLSPPTVWPFSVAVDLNSNGFDFYFLIWSLSRLLCCVGSGFSVAAALGIMGKFQLMKIICKSGLI